MPVGMVRAVLLMAGIWMGICTAAPAEAQDGLDPVALRSAGSLVDAGRLRRGCRGIEAIVDASRLNLAQRRELLHHDRSFARWVRRCVQWRHQRATRERKLPVRAARLVDLARSSLLADRTQMRGVEADREAALEALRVAGLPPPANTLPLNTPARVPDGQAVLAAIRTGVRSMQNCFERNIGTGPTLSPGRLEIAVDRTGVVQNVVFDSTGASNPTVARCLEHAVSRIRFPRAAAPYQLTYPLMVDVAY